MIMKFENCLCQCSRRYFYEERYLVFRMIEVDSDSSEDEQSESAVFVTEEKLSVGSD